MESKNKGKHSLYQPGETLRAVLCWGSQNFQRVGYMSVANLSALCTVRLYRQELLLVLVSVSDLVDPRATVWPAGLNQRKIQMTTSVIETATFRLLEINRITNMPLQSIMECVLQCCRLLLTVVSSHWHLRDSPNCVSHVWFSRHEYL